jgi:hypothetical protein
VLFFTISVDSVLLFIQVGLGHKIRSLIIKEKKAHFDFVVLKGKN